MTAAAARLSALPVVAEGEIGGRIVQTVNAREVHAYLGVRRDFSNWIKDRIATFGFVEGEDFVTYEDLSSPNLASAKARAQTTIKYALTLDMGKELGMVDRSEQGREIRRHFLACERKAMGADVAAPLPPVPHHPPSPALLAREAVATFESYQRFGGLVGLDRNQSILAANRATRKAVGVDLMADMETTHLLAPQQQPVMTPTDIGVELDGRSGMAINSLLALHGLQVGKRDAKDRPYWIPTEAGEPYAVWQDTGKRHGDGTPVRQLKWSAGIVDALRTALVAATESAS